MELDLSELESFFPPLNANIFFRFSYLTLVSFLPMMYFIGLLELNDIGYVEYTLNTQ